MIKRVFILVSILISSFYCKSESYKNVTISILTASPGNELYSLFGHSAIRIQIPLKGIDVVYNYGVFDFNTPNFGIKFLKGNLDYMLAANNYNDFYQSYFWDERDLLEQTLNLSNAEKEKIISLLEENYLPANRYYRYAFLDNNCATRIRDIIEQGLNDQSVFNRASTNYPSMTYRQMLRSFLKGYPWVDFGINIALGLPADKITSNSEKMFLPEYMKQVAAGSKKLNGEPLIEETRTLLASVKEPYEAVNFLTPTSIFFAMLTLSLLGFSASNYSRIFCSIFYFALGVLGLVLTITTFITEHKAVQQNLNILWALPFNIIFFRAAGKSTINKIQRYYFIIIGIISIMLLASWGHFPQQFHPAIIPILITIVVTAVQISFQRYTPQTGKRSNKK